MCVRMPSLHPSPDGGPGAPRTDSPWEGRFQSGRSFRGFWQSIHYTLLIGDQTAHDPVRGVLRMHGIADERAGYPILVGAARGARQAGTEQGSSCSALVMVMHGYTTIA